MRVLSITIQGFKSFADKTVIDVQGDINAIVGPNGCGKSNVIEAVLWALGEQSARELRGNKMDDVIFSGSKERKPASFAEVKITFDNTDHYLPMEYRQIEVSRKLYRSGESEYSINRIPVRMRDIQELFSSSGLSKNSFAIIGQGKVDEFIRHSPQERRRMIDEVSGIAKFFLKRKEATKKLEASQINVDRISDVVQEVEKQAEKLQIQVEAAKTWKDNHRKLIQSEACLKLLKAQESHALFEKVQKSCQEIEGEISQLRNAIGEHEKRKSFAEEELKTAEKTHSRVKEKLHKFDVQKALYDGEAKRIDEAEKSLLDRLKNIEESLRNFSKKTEVEKQEFEAATKSITGLVSAQEKEQAQLACNLEEKNALTDKLLISQKRLQEAHESYIVENSSFSSCKIEAGYLLQRKKERMTAIEAANRKKAQLESDLSKITQEMSGSAKSQIETLKKEIDEKRSFLDRLTMEVKEEETLWKKEEGSYTELVSKVNALQAQKDAREELMLSLLSSDNEGLQEFFTTIGCQVSAQKQRKSEKKLSSPSGVAPQFLADFLGKALVNSPIELVRFLDARYMNTIVLSSFKDLEWVQKNLENRSIAGVSCLVLENIIHSESSVACEKQLLDHLYTCLGFVPSTQAGLTDLKALLRTKTRSPSLLAPSWEIDALGVINIFSNGSKNAIEKRNVSPRSQAGRFTLEKELTEIKKHLEDAKEQIEIKKTSLTAKKAQFERTLMKKSEVNEAMRKLDMTLVHTTFQLSQVEEKKKRLQETIQDIEKDSKKIEIDLKEIEARLHAVESDMKCKQEALDRIVVGKKQEEKILSEIHQALSRVQIEHDKHKNTLLQIEKSIQEYEKKKLRVQALEEERVAYESRLEAEKEAIIQNREILAADRKRLVEDRKETESIFQSVQQEAHALSQNIHQRKKLFVELGKELQVLEKKKEVHEEKMRHYTHEVSKAQTQYEMLLGEYGQFKQDHLEEIPSEDEIFDTKDISKDSITHLEAVINERKKWLQVHKEVNFQAEEEARDVYSRLDLLQKELHDLNESKQAILGLIDDLEAQSRLEFMSAFETIRTRFKENFTTLFDGGDADLKLIGADSILDAGIELSASPPGKEMRTLNLLSGGERCLTAMALLFAIFQVKKAPLCLLDEVDAPLDEANVVRFHRLLEQASKGKTQFLVVTHNKRTMASSSRLIGVSMREKGVSCVVGVELGLMATSMS